METKHTPGPWRKGTPGPNGCYTVGTLKGLMTAMVAHSLNEPDQAEQAEANASLIAGAPELLSIARRWAALDAQWHPDHYESEKAQLLQDTKAAIAKASPQS